MSERLSILIPAEAITARTAELARRISDDCAGRELVVVGILKGAWMFMADLVRLLEIPVQVDFMSVSSYGDGRRSTGVVRITSDLSLSIEGRDVLVVEDIIDTGMTTRYLLDNLLTRNPASIRVCTLLDKSERRLVDVPLDYVGFTIADAFVVGYGLDDAQRYRNLPYVAVVTRD